ncbi:MAG TPA: hypothetical protein VMW94_09770 [Actinomycetes bacterium]|nr:hypothetical protein [Actinomycetes bacterium]
MGLIAAIRRRLARTHAHAPDPEPIAPVDPRLVALVVAGQQRYADDPDSAVITITDSAPYDYASWADTSSGPEPYPVPSSGQSHGPR